MASAECIAVAPDPLLYNTPLPFRDTFYPFGFPAAISSNSQNVLAAAERVWRGFENRRHEPPVELRLAVSNSSAASRPEPRLPTGQGNLVSFIHDAANFVICDLHSGFAYGWLTPIVANDVNYAGYHFVESSVYLLLECLHLAPVHAACVSLNGKGVLLCGNSGAGKSTLAYACAKRGWTFTCDDAAQLIRSADHCRITGNCYQIRLRPHAISLFPELSGSLPFERPNGKPSLELDTAPLQFDVAQETAPGYLVFLNRQSGAPQHLAPFNPGVAFEHLTQVLCFGDRAVRDRMADAIRRLLCLPIYELHYQDLDWAEKHLRQLVNNE